MTSRLLRAVVCAAILLMAFAARARAQGDSQPPGQILLGPVSITPSLVLTGAGVDNNVFNDPVNPKSDVTFTLTPAASIGLRARRVRLTLRMATDYVYFHRYTSERGVNFSSEARADVDLGAFQPYVSVAGLSTRARLNAEVDTRARHRDVGVTAGTGVHLSPTTRIVFSARRQTQAFDPGTSYLGLPLAEAFDGRRVGFDGGLAVELTPATTLTLAVTREQQFFDAAGERDSTSWRIGPRFDFNTLGLLTGSASVGYRRFTTVSAAIPQFTGIVAAVSLSARIYGRHQLATELTRDVQYSYDPAAAYYVGTNGSVTWTSLVAGPIDLRGTLGRQQLTYTATQIVPGDEWVTSIGGGVGFRFSDHARLGLNADWAHRQSDRTDLREYRNHRVFVSLSWGILP